MSINKQIIRDIKKSRIINIHSYFDLYIKSNKDDNGRMIIKNIRDTNSLLNDFLDTIDFLIQNNIIKTIPTQSSGPKLYEMLKNGNLQKVDSLSYENSRYNNCDICITNIKLLKRYIKHDVISDKDYNAIMLNKKILLFTILAIVVMLLIYIIPNFSNIKKHITNIHIQNTTTSEDKAKLQKQNHKLPNEP